MFTFFIDFSNLGVENKTFDTHPQSRYKNAISRIDRLQDYFSHLKRKYCIYLKSIYLNDFIYILFR